MPDDLDEKDSEQIDVQHYLALARRRHIHFLIPFFLGWLVVWAVSWVLPPRYRSGTLILVEQPSMPKDYVTPNVADDLQQRMQSITQQILSRTRLLQIIDHMNLYDSERAHPNPDQRVERMRKDIDIELVRDSQGRINAFNVFYTSPDPHTAQKVTTELTNLFISENLEARQQQSEDTTKFLESQLEDARQILGAQEEKIRQFKAQHIAELPTQLTSNLQILSGVQSQLRAEEDALNAARQQRAYLQTMVSQYRTMQGASQTSGSSPLGLPALDQELDRLKAQLADLSSHYTDRHPDVRKLKEQIAKTEKIRSQILESLKRNSQADGSSAAQESADLGQPLPLLQLQGQIEANQIEIKNREHSVADLKARVSDYQARLNQEPVREQQLADLTRGYDQSKANYDELLKKKNGSAMATSMELLQQGERFRILDPPSLPLNPEFPNRLKFCGIGLGIGLAFGVVVAGIFEFVDDRLYSEKEIKKLLPVPVTCEIPVVSTPLEERSQRARIWRDWAMTGVFALVIVAGSLFSYFRG